MKTYFIIEPGVWFCGASALVYNTLGGSLAWTEKNK